MKKIILLSICLVSAAFVNAKDLLPFAEGKMFESSLYGNMTSIDNNVYLQTDISFGVNFLKIINSSLTINIQYRNYSTITNDFLAISGGYVFKKNEVRLGLVGGLYTLSICGYRDLIPCGGGELGYSYNIINGLSVRFKERIVVCSDQNNRTLETLSCVGFCIAFLDSPKVK